MYLGPPYLHSLCTLQPSTSSYSYHCLKPHPYSHRHHLFLPPFLHQIDRLLVLVRRRPPYRNHLQ
uniref:Uncharacterized protein n=1 Tax=Arundo donax TaxID=35708 RepID=A0A0A8Y979_ARUDO